MKGSHPEGSGPIAQGAEEAHEVSKEGQCACYEGDEDHIGGAVDQPHDALIRDAIFHLHNECTLHSFDLCMIVEAPGRLDTLSTSSHATAINRHVHANISGQHTIKYSSISKTGIVNT